ncbi:hypothetical protein GGI43DRAFT_410125 [Trichoderma evansii]
MAVIMGCRERSIRIQALCFSFLVCIFTFPLCNSSATLIHRSKSQATAPTRRSPIAVEIPSIQLLRVVLLPP